MVYDTTEGATATLQLLEYANSQLLEFRHYDHVLSARLAHVYDSLSTGTGFFSRWRMAREAERLSAMRLEVHELTERVDNAIKFLSDTFSARVNRLAAARIGVPDYRKLAEEKLNTVGELYQFMMDRFYQGRAFALELMVVVILMIELGFLFGGRRYPCDAEIYGPRAAPTPAQSGLHAFARPGTAWPADPRSVSIFRHHAANSAATGAMSSVF